MDETLVVLIALAILFLFLAVGLEVGFSLAIAGFVGLTLGWGSDVAMGYFNTTPFRYAASFSGHDPSLHAYGHVLFRGGHRHHAL